MRWIPLLTLCFGISTCGELPKETRAPKNESITLNEPANSRLNVILSANNNPFLSYALTIRALSLIDENGDYTHRY